VRPLAAALQCLTRADPPFPCPAGGARKVAVAYSIVHFQQQPEGMPCSSYVWDVNNPNTPDFELRSGSQLCCVNYNPKDSSVLLGGMYNGQVAYWDVRKGHTPCDSSPIERSHRDPVYDAAWLPSKTGTECCSVSTDGYVHWWDTRKLNEPVESLQLMERGQSIVLGAVSLEYLEAAKFAVGTEQGVVLSCNRKAKTPAERIGASYTGHHGPVYALRRHPFFPKYFLSVGDWTARVWMEDLKSPVMTTRYHTSSLTGGAWSPTRPGVFFTARGDGALDVWDFFYKQNDPSLTVQITDKALTSLTVQETGRLVMAGAADGSTTLLELCEGLAVAQPGEKQSVSQILDRETKREKNLELRARELKIKARKEGGGKGESAEDDATRAAPERLSDVEQQFLVAVGLASAASEQEGLAPASAVADDEVLVDETSAGGAADAE
jgi:dynein intermediate chain 2